MDDKNKPIDKKILVDDEEVETREVTSRIFGENENTFDYDEELENWFTHHPPQNDEQIAKYQRVREAGKFAAYVIRNNTPRSADQTAALRKLREAVMTANAAIACNDKEFINDGSALIPPIT